MTFNLFPLEQMRPGQESIEVQDRRRGGLVTRVSYLRKVREQIRTPAPTGRTAPALPGGSTHGPRSPPNSQTGKQLPSLGLSLRA